MNKDLDRWPASSSSICRPDETEKPSTVPANRRLSWFGVIAVALISWMKRIVAFLYRESVRTWSHFAKSSINGSVSESKSARVFILDDVSSCDEKLLVYLSRYQFKLNFVGLDCEWVNRKGFSNAPVALLQIATPENDCFLVRLCKMGGILPVSVKKILEDKTILKFGVGIQGDAKKLSSTYGVVVSGCVDLRHVVLRCRALTTSGQPAEVSNKKMSLDALAEQILGVQMDKHWTIRCSNWEAEMLTQRQADYAMNDALVAVHIFLKLVQSKGKERHNLRPVETHNSVSKDGMSFRSSMSVGQSQCTMTDQTGGEESGFQQNDASTTVRNPNAEQSVVVGTKQVDGLLLVADKPGANKSVESIYQYPTTDGLSQYLEAGNLNHGNDTPETLSSFKAAEIHSTVNDTSTSSVTEAKCEDIPTCRRRTFHQPKGAVVSEHKESGTPDRMESTGYESNGFESVDEGNGESYYHERFVTLEKWETTPEQGYVENMSALLGDSLFCQKAISLCQGITDMDFRAQQKKSKKRNMDGEVDGTCMSERVKSKPYKRGTIRKTPLYSKCMLVAPDGAKLCTLDRKKADWYIVKEIGELIAVEPYTVQLKFEPSGRPQAEDSYYLSFKENICVVCGRDESYLRKSIVPHDYRRYFPLCMKDHHCHDILLMCSECHRVSNFYDEQLRQKLAKEYNAPLGTATVARLTEDPELKKVKSAAKALVYSGDKIPEKRCKELRSIILTFYDATDLSEEMIHDATNLDTRKENCNFISHGEEVVKKVRAEKKLLAFERMWRQNFLDNMNPQFLPPMWCVDHHHQKLKRILECLDS